MEKVTKVTTFFKNEKCFIGICLRADYKNKKPCFILIDFGDGRVSKRKTSGNWSTKNFTLTHSYIKPKTYKVTVSYDSGECEVHLKGLCNLALSTKQKILEAKNNGDAIRAVKHSGYAASLFELSTEQQLFVVEKDGGFGSFYRGINRPCKEAKELYRKLRETSIIRYSEQKYSGVDYSNNLYRTIRADTLLMLLKEPDIEEYVVHREPWFRLKNTEDFEVVYNEIKGSSLYWWFLIQCYDEYLYRIKEHNTKQRIASHKEYTQAVKKLKKTKCFLSVKNLSKLKSEFYSPKKMEPIILIDKKHILQQYKSFIYRNKLKNKLSQ